MVHSAREVKNKAFNFSIGLDPAPLGPRASSRRTPQPTPGKSQPSRTPRAGPATATRKTPATKKATPSTAKAASEKRAATANKTKTPHTVGPTSGGAGKTQSTFVTPSATGKRKRGAAAAQTFDQSDADELERDDEEHRPPSSQVAPRSSTRPRLRRSGRNAIGGEDVEDDLNQNDENHILSGGKPSGGSSAKESRGRLGEPRTSATPSKRPKSHPRKALQVLEDSGGPSNTARPVSIRRGRPQKIIEEPSDGEDQLSTRPRSIAQKRPKPKAAAKPVKSALADDRDELEGDEAPVQAALPKKAGQLRPRRSEASEITTPAPTRAKGSKGGTTRMTEGEAGPSTGPRIVSNKPPPQLAAAKQNTPMTRPRVGRPRKSTDQDTLAEAVARESQSSRTVSTALQKLKKRRASTEAMEEDRGVKRQKNSEDAVPVTVYRLFKMQRDSPQEDEEDPLAGPTPDTKLPPVNPIDVFAQISFEISNRYANSLGRQLQRDSLNASQRAEVKRKRTIVQQFINSLSDRLFELTEAADAGTVLRKRLKEVLKEREGLRDEFLDIRKQRDEIALRMDLVREQHRQSTASRRNQDELSVAMFDIELAVKRGKEMAKGGAGATEGPVEPLGMLLKSVAKESSSRDISGGLLQKVKGFRGFLERAVDLFEGRS